MRKWVFVFLLGFVFNLIWENLHSALYLHYQGGIITEFILVRAALWDALIILILILLFRTFKKFARYSFLIIIAGIIISIAIEWFALYTDRWAYAEIMPIIPIIKTGLTPTIQLGLLGYIVYKLVFRK